MKTMKKPALVAFLSVLFVLFMSGCSSKRIVSLLDYGNECETEWSDGKLWAFKSTEDNMVGIAINPAKDHIGVYQMNLIIKNTTSKSIVFDPADISVLYAAGIKSKRLDTYEYPFTPNMGMAVYDEGENIYLLSKMSDKGEDLKQIGYLKKNTVYGGEGIIGYRNFKLGTGTGVLAINIPVGNSVYNFQWYIGKETEQPPVYKTSNQISVVDYNNIFRKKWEDNVLWTYKDAGNYVVGAALCTSSDDDSNYQLKVSIESIGNSSVMFEPDNVAVQYVSGTTSRRLLINNLYRYQGQNTQNVIGYIERTRWDRGIIRADVSVGGEVYSFQWSVGFSAEQLPVYKTTNQISVVDYDGVVTEEWKDGILWAYRDAGDYEIWAALCTSSDDDSNYQLKLSIKPEGGSPVTINTDGITAQLANGRIVQQLGRNNFSTYKEQDGQSVIGYIERDWSDEGIIKVDVPVGDKVHSFQWGIK